MAIFTVCIGSPEEGNTKGMIVDEKAFQARKRVVEKRSRQIKSQSVKDHEMLE